MLNRYLVALFVAIASVTLSAQSQFGNNKVLAGSTCPPVTAPLGGAGTLYTCTGTGALYTWTGSAWVAAGGGGGTPSNPDTGLQTNNTGSFGASAFALLSPSTGHSGWGTNAEIDGGSMNGNTVNAVFSIQNLRTSLAAATISTNIYNANDLTPAADIVGARRHTGQYNDIRFLGTHNAANTEFYGHLTDLTMNGAGTALWAFGNQSAVYVFDNQGNITEVYGANHYIYSQSTAGNITNAYGVSAYPMQHYGGGTVTNSYGVYVWPVAGSGTITNNYGIWISAQERAASCSYDFWADEQGVFRIRADTTFNSVTQAIPALYNPQFTKYTPCATNHERIVLQWESNVAVLTTEAGGTGVLRGMRIGDTGVSVEYGAILNGTALKTDTTNAHTALIQAYDVDGAAYSTFATLTNGNTPTMALASPSGGTLTIASWTGPSVLTEVVGSSGLTLTGATQTSSFPVLNMTQTWNASGTTFTAMKLNVTNTASAAASLLADFQVGNSTQASISKTGSVLGSVATGGSASAVAVGAAANRGLWSSGSTATVMAAGGISIAQADGGGTGTFLVPADTALGFGPNNASGNAVGSTVSAAFYRDAAQTIAQRNSTNAQAFRLYNTFTSSTSYERLDIDWTTTANVILIGAQKGSGGGTARVMSLVYGGTSTAAISIPITSGDITFGGVLAPTGYKSADGTAGATVTTCTSFKNGLCVAGT